ncbi:MAG TPA: IclR family transcriptional regulator C-terminal domain-containing protein [Burkholderiaceae bacterium]|nr:IclR family transcriptional regulator C-terminal domain-containing protein [Burkholderiaceae bacterium]
MNKAELHIEPQDLIAGLGRGLAVIECFDDEHARMTPAEVAARTHISRTAARRYLLSLCYFGYAQTDGKTFWLEPRVLRLGQSYLLSARLPRLAQPFLQRLATASEETASLAVLDGHEVIYLARHGATRLMTAGFALGARLPAHVVSVGHVILAALPDDELDAWIAGHQFSAFTQFTDRDPAHFRADIVRSREQGYAITDQQLELGWRGIAVPLRNRHGECLGGLSVTVPVDRMTIDETIARMLPPLREAESGLRGLL